MIVELNTHKVIHVCRGGKAHQYRARKRSILTVKIEEQNKKKIDFSHYLWTDTILSFIQIMYFFSVSFLFQDDTFIYQQKKYISKISALL